ncbi:MAG TPA: metal-dependent hydrolase [Candidatus Bilamarchaeum sp.]|nr:metal-dependent hydrolase [Candidatus Bilamarchaeum sp.]
MDWKAHTVVGAVFALAAVYVFEVRAFPELVFFAFFGALCALVPDLDIETSKGRQMLDFAMLLFALCIGYLYACRGSMCLPALESLSLIGTVFFLILGAYFFLFRVFKPRHRGITHTLAACCVFAAIVYVAGGLLPALAGFAGYLSHLVADRHLKLV